MANRLPPVDRRAFLQLLGASAALSMAPMRGRAAASAAADRKLLFVFCAYGGASIIDSFLPVVDYEGGSLLAAAELNCYSDFAIEQLPDSNIRSVKLLDNYSYFAKPTSAMGSLIARHGKDMAVIGHDVSSVNHTVGQQRSLNAAGLDQGRTLMERAALRHGMDLPLASCNMAAEGYQRHGVDPTVPARARHELIRVPSLFGAGTSGFEGVAGAPSEEAVRRARAVREELDQKSVFARTFRADPRLQNYLHARKEVSPILERAGLLEKLLLLDPSRIDPALGVKPDPLAVKLRESLPALGEDRMEAQIALSFLLAYHGVSCSVAMGFDTEPVVRSDGSIIGTPISFDFSHNMHRVVQNLMWCRTASLVDSLITLLKSHDYLGDPALGRMWDRSLIYIATEFGRDKKRPFLASSWGTGHHLNNGSVLLSPLLKGNAVYGGVDPTTGMTFGFDPATGKPDKMQTMTETDVYGIIAQALDLQTSTPRKYGGVVRG
jgi:uncharacterized protein (DUF1501 family)